MYNFHDENDSFIELLLFFKYAYFTVTFFIPNNKYLHQQLLQYLTHKEQVLVFSVSLVHCFNACIYIPTTLHFLPTTVKFQKLLKVSCPQWYFSDPYL